jgi:ATP-dependent exoDNAse (exonuclease V) beta subunit
MSNKDQDSLLDLPKVIVVQASAGSGKTYALAKRYLQLLINPGLNLKHIPLRAILAITFTNKATVEMKARILELLKRIALDIFSNQDEKNDIFSSLAVTNEQAREKAGYILDEIIRNYNFFQVKTIDSFINALLLGCAFNIDRSAHFSIKRDYKKHLNYCLDLVIDQASMDSKIFSFLEEFLEHYLFVENRQGWFPRDSILQLLESLFVISNKHARIFQVNPGKSVDVIKKKKHLFSLIDKLSAGMPAGLNANARKSIIRFIENSQGSFNISALPGAFKNQEPPLNKGSQCSKVFESQWRKIHGYIIDLVEFEAYVVHNPYIHFFHQLLFHFENFAKKEDVLFLEQLNRTARRLFDDESFTVAEAYYRLAARFKHYLIDEFQDTSRIQWDNLYLMIEDALSSGGSLFYVGDKKQAIYRFRGGRVELFDEVKKHFSHFNVSTKYLAKNWRSQKEIVDFNNRIFSKNNIQQAIVKSGVSDEIESNSCGENILSVFSDSFQEHHPDKTAGYVELECVDEDNQRERNEIMNPRLIELIADLRKRFSASDIAILTRDNTEVELVTSWLLDKKIPVESEKTLNVTENYLIKGLVALLKFLHSPIDDIAFASFITSDFFSKSAQCDNHKMHEFLFLRNSRKDLNFTQALYNDFRSSYRELWDFFVEDFFYRVGFVSPYELCLSIYERYKVFDNFSFAQGFFMKFLELIKANESEIGSLSQLLDYLSDEQGEDFYINVAESNAIKILTIHKSKGLEFPVVIIPFLRMDITPETIGKGTNTYIPDEEAERLELTRITKVHRQFSERLQKIYAQNYELACIDELNTMYVALTRAECELYVFIPSRSGSSKNKARDFIANENITLGQKLNYPLVKVQSDLPEALSAPVYCDWIGKLKSEFKSPREFKNRERVLEGIMLHEILSGIGNCFALDKEDVLKKAVESLRNYNGCDIQIKACKEKVRSILFDEKFEMFFSSADADIFCEKDITNKHGDLKRIDRLMVNQKKKEIVIVDYKLSCDDESKDKDQVNEYKALVSQIYTGYDVKGFLIYINERRKLRLI